MAVRGGRSLSQQIEAFAAKVQRRSDVFVQQYVLGLTRDIVDLSPVGNPESWKMPPAPGYVPGHFKNNWQVSAGSRPSGVLEGTDSDGAATVSRATSVLAGTGAGSVFIIANNVPYGPRLEYGWSQQAPAGMVRITLSQAGTIAREAAALARRTG